jgi:hypothetical protein
MRKQHKALPLYGEQRKRTLLESSDDASMYKQKAEALSR